MKVAIPTRGSKGLDDQLFDHFGKAPTYTIADLDSGGLTVIDNTSLHLDGQGGPAKLIGSTGATVVLVGHLGERAAEQCQLLGIKVLCGASGTVADVLQQYNRGELSPPSSEHHCPHHH